MASIKQKVLALAKERDVEVESGNGFGGCFEVALYAPEGHHFAGAASSVLVTEHYVGESQKVWRGAYEDLTDHDVVPCTAGCDAGIGEHEL